MWIDHLRLGLDLTTAECWRRDNEYDGAKDGGLESNGICGGLLEDDVETRMQ